MVSGLALWVRASVTCIKGYREYQETQRKCRQYIRETNEMLSKLLHAPSGNLCKLRGSSEDLSLQMRSSNGRVNVGSLVSGKVRNLAAQLCNVILKLFGGVHRPNEKELSDR